MCSHLSHQELIRNPSGAPGSTFLMSSYAAEMLHGLDRADSPLPTPPQTLLSGPLPRGRRERSAGIYRTPEAAERARRRVERGLAPRLAQVALEPLDKTKAKSLVGDYSPTPGGRPGGRSTLTRPTTSASASRSGSCPRSAMSRSPRWTPIRSAPGKPGCSPRACVRRPSTAT
jgi:hypothetical protein